MSEHNSRNLLRAGMGAYIDSMSGLVACHVLSIENPTAPNTTGPASSAFVVRVRVTARTRTGSYRAREVVETSALHIVPRACIRRRQYSTRIVPYFVECDKPLTGYDGSTYGAGDTVEASHGRGFGVVVRTRPTERDRVTVRMAGRDVEWTGRDRDFRRHIQP